MDSRFISLRGPLVLFVLDVVHLRTLALFQIYSWCSPSNGVCDRTTFVTGKVLL